MTCKRGLLAVEGLVAPGRRRVRIGVDEKRKWKYYTKICGAGEVHESSVIYVGRYQ
jgi:hypothetical protein